MGEWPLFYSISNHQLKRHLSVRCIVREQGHVILAYSQQDRKGSDLTLKCVFPYKFYTVLVNFNHFVPPETSCSVSIYVWGLKISVHTDWLFGVHAFVNRNGYDNFPTLLIEKVARLIDVRTLQFLSVGDVLSPCYNIIYGTPL